MRATVCGLALYGPTHNCSCAPGFNGTQ